MPNLCVLFEEINENLDVSRLPDAWLNCKVACLCVLSAISRWRANETKKSNRDLASPSDFRYQEMKRDRTFLEILGWKTKWIEFQGGHRIAPAASYDQAARWLIENWTPALRRGFLRTPPRRRAPDSLVKTLDSGYNRSYTFFVKTAISIPDKVFRSADALAKRLGISRSELYSTAIAEFLSKHQGRHVTMRLDTLYAEEDSSLSPNIIRLQAKSLTREEW